MAHKLYLHLGAGAHRSPIANPHYGFVQLIGRGLYTIEDVLRVMVLQEEFERIEDIRNIRECSYVQQLKEKQFRPRE